MGLAACGKSKKSSSSTSTAKTVTIGFVGAKTGDNANLGINIRDGIKVAIAEENAKKDGPTIALKEFDTGGDPAQATTVAPQFIQDTSIIGTVGPAFSGETKALIPLYQDAGLVFISPSATNVHLPGIVANETVFHRVIADDALQASGIASYLSQTVKPKSVAFVNDNSEYGKGLADDVQRLSVAKGIKAATTQVVDPKAQDFSATVNAIKASGADTVFYGGYYAEAGRLRKQLVDAGVKATFVSGDGSLDPGFVTAAGPAAAEGAKLTCPCNLAFSTSSGALKTFFDAFKKTIGKNPGLYSPEAYDAAKILIKGIKAGNTTRASLLDFVRNKLGTYEGVSKTIKFESDGNIGSTQFFVFEVKGGAIAPSETVTADKPPETTSTVGPSTSSTASASTTTTAP
jgi:branched-chain amino acid transport system substrate-binding protein